MRLESQASFPFKCLDVPYPTTAFPVFEYDENYNLGVSINKALSL